MNYIIRKKIPPVAELIRQFSLSNRAFNQVASDRQAIKNIIEGKDKRRLLIIGPCSAWPKEAVLEYAVRLKQLHEKVKHTLKIVMRVYIQKPRTTKGWIGSVNQPDIFSSPDIEAGIQYTREMMMNVIEIGLPIADEALFTHNAEGFIELLSWVAIGARSSENQEHRIFASSLDFAVGLKNPTHGSLSIGVNGVITAQNPHVTVLNSNEVQTYGNAHAHLVLRGSNSAPNYSVSHLNKVKQLMETHKINNPSVIIDLSHDNCLVNGEKDHTLQPTIALKVINSLNENPNLKPLVKGFMLESFIKEGKQVVDLENPEAIDLDGLSITDPCLGWNETEAFILKLASIKS